jgi:glucose-1-phosphate adenylyltransferase
MAYPFRDPATGQQPYWRDVGTIDAYWAANIDLTMVTPALDMYDRDWPIWTYQEQLPPAKFVFDDDERRGMAIDSIVSGGCIVSGSRVRRSVLFSSVRVHSYCTVEGAVILPRVTVGRGARLTNVVVDRGCEIPEGFVVGEDATLDAARFYRTDAGITLITRERLAALR